MDQNLKRISLMIREDQHELLSQRGLNLSGLVRDLIDDYFSSNAITITVTEDTKKLYDQIVSNTGATDKEVEPYFKNSLHSLLSERIKAIKILQKNLTGE